MEKSIRLLLLSLIPGIGPARIKALVGRFPDLEDLRHAEIADFITVPGIGEPLAREIHGFLHNPSKRQDAEKAIHEQLGKLLALNGTLLTLLDTGYPPLLREIYDPPPCLFIRGRLPAPAPPWLAVVGTRKASQYGKHCTELFSKELSGLGIVICSGMAYGIDMAAHHAALEGGGSTVAVLAGGIDNVYTDPKGKIWPKILEQGALVSEDWIGSPLHPSGFPRRNRIISGLSAGTLVVESDLKGGALITAETALEQNREVFAVPGSIFSPLSRGTNRLIREGQAKAVLCIDDILCELGFSRHDPGPEKTSCVTRQADLQFSENEQEIIRVMGREPIHIDLLAEKTGLGIGELLVDLFELEMKKAVVQSAGQMFQKSCR
jgi:DNA processing protein